MPVQLQTPVEHPADVVIDVFGTFLGKRSERMVVRWREQPEHACESLEDSPSTPMVVRFPQPSAAATSESCAATNHPAFEPNSTADQAAQGLLDLWEPELCSSMIRLSPAIRQRDRLDALADHAHDNAASAWRERNIPLARLRSVTVCGRGITISTDLITALVERGITLSFLSHRGSPVAHLSAPGLSGTVQTRRSQLEAYYTPLGVQLAKTFVVGKLRNQQHQLQYSGKYLKSSYPERFSRLEKRITMLKNLRRQVSTVSGDSLDSVRDKLMGFEGTGARIYWEGVAIILEGQVEFPGRQTRGAIDPINSALNYGYGILYSQVSAAVLNAGLELFAGFLHGDRPGKPALVLDLVEEFRAPVVDRAILALVNQGISLETNDSGLTPATRRLIADRVLERLHTSVPYEGKHWPLVTVIQHQARHLAVAVRGERAYQPFSSRW